MRRCAICKSLQRNFGVPQDDKRRKRWSQICGVELHSKARICIEHFSPSCIINMGRQIRLMPFAEPSLLIGNRGQQLSDEQTSILIGNRVQQLIDEQTINQEKQQRVRATENPFQDLYNYETITTDHGQECYEDSQIFIDPLQEKVEQLIEFKCGEIFYNNFTEFRISCDFCNSKPISFDDFLKHLRKIHFQNNECNEKLQNDEEEEEEGEDECLVSFEEVQNLLEKDNSSYISENTDEIVENDYCVNDDVNVVPLQQDQEKVNGNLESEDIGLDMNEKDANDEEVYREIDNEDEEKEEYEEVNREINNEEEEKVEEEKNNENLMVVNLRPFNFEEDQKSDIDSGKDNDDMDEFLPSAPKADDNNVKGKLKMLLVFQCSECPEKFNLRKLLDHHVFEKHGGYKCSMCDKRCRMRPHLRRHEARHKFRKYSCTVPGCNKTFSDFDYTKRHIEAHNSDSKEYIRRKSSKYVCEICGYRCQASANLQIHQRIHTGEKPFSCEICDKRYRTQNALKTHAVIHYDERKYKCDICEAAFKSSGVLKRHKYLHANERQFKCNYCDKSFRQPHCRSSHIKQVHKGIKHIRAKRKRKQNVENAKPLSKMDC